jgi:hypothetical protein
MTRRKRGILVVLGLFALLVTAEVALNVWRGSQVCVEVTNQGAVPIDDLVLSLGTSRASAGRVEPGASARLYLTGRRQTTLLMTFRQRGNPLGSYQVAGFDPALLNAEGFKLVLNVRPNEIERFQDDADPATPIGRLLKAAWDAFRKAFEIPR